MQINGKPRIIIWIVSPDQRFIGNAVNILTSQFNGVDIVGVTANVQIAATDNLGRAVPFIPIQELSGKGGGMTFFLLPVLNNSVCRRSRKLPSRLISTSINFWAIG